MEKLAKMLEPARAWFRAHPSRLWLLVIALTAVAAFFSGSRDDDGLAARPEALDSADTFIPDGFVLVPIDVVNYEALDSVLGPFGVVDLFAADADGRREARPVARRIKILRAPRNPSQFAVLAPSAAAPALVRHGSGFIVVVQNPKRSGTAIEPASGPQASSLRRSRIHVETQDEN